MPKMESAPNAYDFPLEGNHEKDDLGCGFALVMGRIGGRATAAQPPLRRRFGGKSWILVDADGDLRERRAGMDQCVLGFPVPFAGHANEYRGPGRVAPAGL